MIVLREEGKDMHVKGVSLPWWLGSARGSPRQEVLLAVIMLLIVNLRSVGWLDNNTLLPKAAA